MVIKNFGYDDDIFDDQFQQQFATKAEISPVVSQEEAERAAKIANSYPNLPPSVIAAAAQLGLGFDDNRLEEIAKKAAVQKENAFNKIKRFTSENPLANQIKNNRFFQIASSPIDNIVKPATRTAVTGFVDIYEAIFPALARANELQDQNPDMAFGDAYKQAVKGTLRTPKMLEAIRSGEQFDLGRGWLKLSTDPSDTKEYKRLVSAGYDPIQAREYVLENVLGTQIDIESRETAENIVQFQGELGQEFKNAGLNPSVSPGRKVFQELGLYDLYEPGTKQAQFGSGALDFGFQLLSPENWATAGVGKIKDARKLFQVAERGIRSTFHGPTLQQYLAGSKGQNFKKLLWENADNPFEFMTRTKQSITDATFFSDLKKLKSESGLSKYDKQAEGIMDEFLSSKVVREGMDKAEGLGSARLIEATNMYVPQVIRGNGLQKAMKLYFAPAFGRLVDANDPADALQNLYRFTLQSKAFLKQSEEGTDLANKLLNNAIDAYGKGGDIGASLNKVVSDWLEGDFRKVLIDSGVKESVAKAATKITREFSDDAKIASDMNKGLYGMDMNGKNFPLTEVLKGAGVDDVTNQTIGRALFSTQLNNTVYLPELNDVIKASNQMNKNLRGNMTKLVDTIGGDKSESFIQFLDWYNSSVFKPLALLKPAWTVKVVGEEQLRLISRGLVSAPLAPIQVIARVFGRSVGADEGGKLRKGVDPLTPGEAAGGDWASDLAYLDSQTGINNVRTLRRKAINPGRWGKFDKTAPEYKQAAVRTIYQIINDDVAVLLAKIDASDLTPLQKEQEFRKLADRLKNKDLKERLEKVVGQESHPFNNALRDDEVALEYVYYLRAALNQTLGGRVIADEASSALNWVQDIANKDLLNMIANGGKFTTTNGKKMGFLDAAAIARSKAKADKVKKKMGDKEFDKIADDYINGKITEEDLALIAPLFKEAQDDIVNGFFGTYIEDMPELVRGYVDPTFQLEKTYDKTINSMFTTLMTLPTNKLSRSPAFRRLYWKRVSETIEFLGKDARDEMVTIANTALKEFTKYDPKLAGYLKKINNAKFSGPAEAITDVKLYDKMIASDALTQTKKLLYDISERTVVGDSLRFAFPFLEAYLEIFKTWSDITNKAGGKNLVNLNKLVQSGSEPNPLADPTGQRGFFYTNPVNGEEVFGYPGTGLVQKWMFPEFEGTGVEAEFPVYVSSLNLVADIMPGVGPIIRVPASYLRKQFPAEGKYNKLIFGDFTPPSGFLNNAVPFPAWLKKFYQAYKQGGTGSADLNRMFNNTVIDTYKALIYAGAIDDSTPQGAEEGLQLATDYAQRIFMIRGASQLIGPAGAASPIWSVTDKSGNAFFVEALADTYRDYKSAAQGDDYEATQRFIQEFGLDPTAMLTSKSRSVVARPATVFSADWARENKDLYEDFNTTAFYLTPTDVDNEFSYDAYLNALSDGTLAPRTPEQWVLAKNRLLGSIAYENFLRNTKIGNSTLMNTNVKTAQLLKWMKQSQLMEQYWGYGQDAGFEVDKPDTDFLLREMGGETYLPDRSSSFVTGWINEDYTPIEKLKANNAAIAYGKYRQQYDRIVAEAIKRNYAPSSIKSNKDLVKARQYLRNYATKLILEYPEFGPLWNSILENDLREEISDMELLGI
jgi:hypothetical protein